MVWPKPPASFVIAAILAFGVLIGFGAWTSGAPVPGIGGTHELAAGGGFILHATGSNSWALPPLQLSRGDSPVLGAGAGGLGYLPTYLLTWAGTTTLSVYLCADAACDSWGASSSYSGSGANGTLEFTPPSTSTGQLSYYLVQSSAPTTVTVGWNGTLVPLVFSGLAFASLAGMLVLGSQYRSWQLAVSPDGAGRPGLSSTNRPLTDAERVALNSNREARTWARSRPANVVSADCERWYVPPAAGDVVAHTRTASGLTATPTMRGSFYWLLGPVAVQVDKKTWDLLPDRSEAKIEYLSWWPLAPERSHGWLLSVNGQAITPPVRISWVPRKVVASSADSSTPKSA